MPVLYICSTSMYVSVWRNGTLIWGCLPTTHSPLDGASCVLAPLRVERAEAAPCTNTPIKRFGFVTLYW